MKMGYNKHKEEDVVYMKKEKDKVYKVEIKPKWELNFAAKFYLVCIIVFVLLVAYIQIYRHIHRDEIIQNIIERENKVVVEWYFRCNYDGNVDGFNGVTIAEFDADRKICDLKEFQSKAEHCYPYGE